MQAAAQATTTTTTTTTTATTLEDVFIVFFYENACILVKFLVVVRLSTPTLTLAAGIRKSEYI